MKLFDSPIMRETIHRLLRSQMALKGVDYTELAERLESLGVKQSANNLRSKINSGSLGAQLFVFIQIALGIRMITIDDVKEIYEDVAHGLSLREASVVKIETSA